MPDVAALDAEARACLSSLGDEPLLADLTLESIRQGIEPFRAFMPPADHPGAEREPWPEAPVPSLVWRPTSHQARGTLLYLHGGGWVSGSASHVEGACRLLAVASGLRVVAPDYRLAPEHPYPAAIEDSRAVAEAVTARWQGPVIVAGDSAGANLALAVGRALRHRERAAAGLLLVVPAIDPQLRSPSSRTTGDQPGLLRRSDMAFFWSSYLQGADVASPDVAALDGDLEGLPPTRLVTAGHDILRDEGRWLADALREAGVRVTHDHRPSLPHDIVWLCGAVGEARLTVQDGARWCRRLVDAATRTPESAARARAPSDR